MTIHDEKRVEWYREGLYSLITGFLFGATNSFVGHPFDTIKTKMQA
jgi:solute carrier family 25 carnitine/acylcarnitine transporter 20/29